MGKTTNPYLTVINAKVKYNPDDFKDFEYESVDVIDGDWGKKTALLEKMLNLHMIKLWKILNVLELSVG